MQMMLGASLLYAAFCTLLYMDAQQPSFTGIPIPAEHYYFAQTLFIIPLLLLGWRVFTAITARIAPVPSDRRLALNELLGRAYGAPLILLYLLPDLIVYHLYGFDALAPAMRIYAPLCLIAILILSTRALRRLTDIPLPRALLAASAGFFANALLVGTFVR